MTIAKSSYAMVGKLVAYSALKSSSEQTSNYFSDVSLRLTWLKTDNPRDNSLTVRTFRPLHFVLCRTVLLLVWSSLRPACRLQPQRRDVSLCPEPCSLVTTFGACHLSQRPLQCCVLNTPAPPGGLSKRGFI